MWIISVQCRTESRTLLAHLFLSRSFLPWWFSFLETITGVILDFFYLSLSQFSFWLLLLLGKNGQTHLFQLRNIPDFPPCDDDRDHGGSSQSVVYHQWDHWKSHRQVSWVLLDAIPAAAAAAAKLLQSCPTLCNPIDSSPSGSAFLGILQARTLEWVAIFSSNTGKWKVKVKSFYPLWLFATPWGFPGKSAGVGCHCLLHPPAIRSTNLFSVFIDLSAANIYRKWNDKMAMLLWLASFT